MDGEPMSAKLHRWTDAEGQEWVCAAYDHGPLCRRCWPVDGALAGCLDNVERGFMEMVGTDTAEPRFRLTPAGEEHVHALMSSDPDMLAIYLRASDPSSGVSG